MSVRNLLLPVPVLLHRNTLFPLAGCKTSLCHLALGSSFHVLIRRGVLSASLNLGFIYNKSQLYPSQLFLLSPFPSPVRRTAAVPLVTDAVLVSESCTSRSSFLLRRQVHWYFLCTPGLPSVPPWDVCVSGLVLMVCMSRIAISRHPL